MAGQRSFWSMVIGLLAVVQASLTGVGPGAPPPEVDEAADAAGAQATQVPNVDTIVVDAQHALAADTNPGTAAAPLATIGRALQLAETRNRVGVGSRIVVGPGTYRETVRLGPGAQATQAPLIIEGSGPGRTVVSGSDVWTDWTRQQDTLVHSWPHRWGLTPLPSGWQSYWDERDISPVVQRREQIFADGQQLRQVLNRQELSATPGSFLVDETAGTVTVRLPAGMNASSARLEVATRRHLFRSSGWNNVTVRGITFQHAVNAIQEHAVVVENSRNVTIEQSEVLWGNWSGLGVIWSRDVTVRDTRMNSSGAVGFIVYQSSDVLFEGSENSYNNWRGGWGNFRNWEDGSKVWGVRGMVVRNHTAVHNNSYGLWFDYDNADVRVENSFLAHNALTGLFLEASQGPFTIQGNTICNNHRWGVMDGKAAGVTLVGNRIFNNGETQLIHTGRPGARGVTAWDSGNRLQVHSERWTIRDNVIAGAQASQQLVWVNTDAADWSILRRTRTSAGNTFHNPATTRVFRLQPGGTSIDLPAWQQATGQDTTSRFAAPAQPLRCEATSPTTNPVVDGPAPTAPDPADWAAAEQRMMDKLNAERSAHNLPLLREDTELLRVARAWTRVMELQAAVAPNPSLNAEVQRDWRELSQNVGSEERAGASAAELVDLLHAAFMASEPHRANVLRPDFTWAGVGVRVTSAGRLWATVNFMSTEDAPATPPGRFSDVTGGPHAAAIEAIAQRGVTQGCSGDQFCPTQVVTRGQMASFLTRALGLPSADGDHFSDDGGSTHEAAINSLAAAGITGGCAEARFCPGAPVTRAQMASFLQRAFELPPIEGQRFSDVEPSTHLPAINAIAEAGITLGCAEGRYCPQQSVRRGEMASFLARALGLV